MGNQRVGGMVAWHMFSYLCSGLLRLQGTRIAGGTENRTATMGNNWSWSLFLPQTSETFLPNVLEPIDPILGPCSCPCPVQCEYTVSFTKQIQCTYLSFVVVGDVVIIFRLIRIQWLVYTLTFSFIPDWCYVISLDTYVTLNNSLSNLLIPSQRLVTMPVSLHTWTVLCCLIILVLSIKSLFPTCFCHFCTQ